MYFTSSLQNCFEDRSNHAAQHYLSSSSLLVVFLIHSDNKLSLINHLDTPRAAKHHYLRSRCTCCTHAQKLVWINCYFEVSQINGFILFVSAGFAPYLLYLSHLRLSVLSLSLVTGHRTVVSAGKYSKIWVTFSCYYYHHHHHRVVMFEISHHVPNRRSPYIHFQRPT